MTTATVWVAAAALWVGCLLPGPWPLVAGIVLPVVALRASSSITRMVLVAAGLLLVGSGIAGARLLLLSTGPLIERARAGGEAVVEATVATDARPSVAGGWQLIRVTRIDGVRSGRRALLRVDAVDDAPPLGSRIRFHATSRPLGDEPFEEYLRRLHVGVEVHSTVDPVVVRGSPLIVAHTSRIRARVRSMAAAHLPPDHAALLSGLVTGDTTGLSQTTLDMLRASGLTHLVAVSG